MRKVVISNNRTTNKFKYAYIYRQTCNTLVHVYYMHNVKKMLMLFIFYIFINLFYD